jgi:hypothetical protein
VLTQAPPVSATVYGDSDESKHFDEDIFGINLPAGWTFAGKQTKPNRIYTWNSANQTQSLDVYVDAKVADFVLNRLIAVQGNGATMTVDGNVSDNCVNFTGTSDAKWQNIHFMCDTANYNRQIAGIGSTDGLNMVKLSGDTSGPHALFFVYNDTSINPDYNVFSDALRSLKLK